MDLLTAGVVPAPGTVLRAGCRATVRFRRSLTGVAVAVLLLLVAGCHAAERAAPKPGVHAPAVRVRGVDPLAAVTHRAPAAPAGAVLTERGDESRLGWNAAEGRLTATAVRTGLRQVSDLALDGKVYAQPLYAPGVGGRDLVVVATEHDSVYAFDAGAHTPVWHTSVGTPFDATTEKVGSGLICDSVTPEVGVNSTPVIDWATRTVYLLALGLESGAMVYRMHALDLATGRELRRSAPLGGTVTGRALDTAGGRVTFDPRTAEQRMALTLVGGIVYAGFASWCGAGVYHGWILGDRAADLTPAVLFNTSPDAYGGGLWESSAGITVDRHGHLVVVTGNGPYDLDTGGADLGDSMLELTPQDGTLRLADSFTPFDQECRNRHDRDLGSGSPLAVPGHDEYVLSSKTGAVYVLSAGALGGYTRATFNPCTAPDRTDVDHIKQELTVDSVPGGMWGTWAYWKGASGEYVYSSGSGAHLTEWKLRADGTIDPHPVARTTEAFLFPGAIPVTSGSSSGVLWTIDGSATLRAYDAADIRRELFHAPVDGFNHFQVPTVADGQVFVGGAGHLLIFGL